MKKPHDIVFEICERMLRHSPEASYARLNPALRTTLANCIAADLPFQRDTFQRIYEKLRGHWWFGDGAGSAMGEHFYSVACECNHAAAQQSFEQFAERPGVLWEENNGRTERLHVGSQFSWRGHYVTITSMRGDSLVACTYKDSQTEVEGLKVGATIGYGDQCHVISHVRKDGAATVLRVVKAGKSATGRVPERRFTIPYADIIELRRTSRKRVKAMVEKIAACDPQKDASRLTGEINAGHYRHFELEEIRDAFNKRREWFANASRIEAWRKGQNGAWLDVKQVLVRVNGDRVECSNGNCISLAAARAALPVLLDRRKTPGSVSLPVDGHYVNRITATEVTIGCTTVPWPEIDRITPELLSTKTPQPSTT